MLPYLEGDGQRWRKRGGTDIAVTSVKFSFTMSFLYRFFVGRRRRSIFSLLFLFGVVYSLGTIFWRSDTSHVSSNSVSIVSEYLQDLQQGAAKTEPSLTNEPACKLPSLNAEHPKVMQFIKDIGPLVCKGNTFSSFDRDVLAVKGDGIASVKYWTVARKDGDDFNRELVGPTIVSNAFTGKEKKNLKAVLNNLEPGQLKLLCIPILK